MTLEPIGGILVVGDANVDLVLRGDVVPRFGQAEQLLDGLELVLGGSGAIVAAGLARLGVTTFLAAVIGVDRFGAFVAEALATAGVDTTALLTLHTESTGASVILSAPDDRAILTHAGAIPFLTSADVRAAVEATGPVHVHFASYFLLPALAAELPGVLSWLRSLGISTSIDTNWDPRESWQGLGDVLPLVDIVFPNGVELRAIAAALGVAGEDDRDSASALAGLGPRVVVKSGADGGWSVDGDGALSEAPGLPVAVVDTTGAGDSFDAAYLAAIRYGLDLESPRLRWAATAGSLSTLGSGGTATQPDLTELLARIDP